MEREHVVKPESEQEKVMPWEHPWWQEADEDLYKKMKANIETKCGEPINIKLSHKPSIDTILKIDEDPIVQLLYARSLLSPSADKVLDKIEETTGVDVRGVAPGPIIPLEWLGLFDKDHKDKEIMMLIRCADLIYGVYPPIRVSRKTIAECKDRLRQFSPIRDYVDELEADESNGDEVQIIE
jgi:hypothetical protein